ncbi:MAG: hypothetical protein KatS3mg024_2074 [Armatimonadota bacterium]|nr:MAG: hypothetical protein KatS3mg024_2074 [Armatimonadota bacterium]
MRALFVAGAVALLFAAPAVQGTEVMVVGPATDTLIAGPADFGKYTPLLDTYTMTVTWRAAATKGTYTATKDAAARPYGHQAYYIKPSEGKFFPAGTTGLLFTAREDVNGPPMSKGLVGTNTFAGVSIGSITKLSYWTSYPRTSFSYSNEIPVSLQLWLTDGVNKRFVEWQPNHSLVKLGQVMVDGVNRWQWNEWNVLDDSHGTFRVYQDPVQSLTWSQFQAAYGNWYFENSLPFGDDVDAGKNLTGTSFTFQMGAPKLLQAGMANNGGDAWYQNQISTCVVDRLEIAYGGQEWLYDFEIVPEPASMLVLGSGLLGMAGLLRRSRRA